MVVGRKRRLGAKISSTARDRPARGHPLGPRRCSSSPPSTTKTKLPSLTMSQFTVPVETAARPNMRRKSSAQNLLSSFKPTTSSQPAPPSAATPVVSTSIGAASMNSVYPSVATPTAGASSREWDAQSLHSDPSASGHGGVTSPALGQGASVDYLRDVIQKRIITLTYLRSVFEGYVRSHSIRPCRN